MVQAVRFIDSFHSDHWQQTFIFLSTSYRCHVPNVAGPKSSTFDNENKVQRDKSLPRSHLTLKTQFSELSTQVLTDTLAALPMEHVVRMAHLSHEKVRQTCSLKWVTDRMTDVILGAVVRAHQAKGDVAETFLHRFNKYENQRKSSGIKHWRWTTKLYECWCRNIQKKIPKGSMFALKAVEMSAIK